MDNRYTESKEAMQNIVDMPESHINRFIRYCLVNNGTLSKAKRDKHFSMLTTREITQLESVVARAYKGLLQ